MHAIPLIVMRLSEWRIDRDLVKVGAPETGNLRIDVRMDPARQEGIIGEVDARHNVRGAERDLFGFRKKVVGIAVQHQLADGRDRYHFLGHDLRRVENVERQGVRLFLGEDLDAQFVLGVGAGFDRFPQIPAMKVGIRAGDLDRFVPDE
jgi:hypothetical protein